MMRVVVRTYDVVQGGQTAVDALSAVGVARCLHLAVVGKLHLIHFLCRGGEGGGHRLVVRAELLSPDVFGATGLQLIGHRAVFELLVGNFCALCLAAGVQVVAVFDFGVVPGKGVVFVVVGVVRAEVEAVGQGTVAILTTYKSANFSSLFRDSEVALDNAVGNGKLAINAYPTNHAC